MHKFLIVLLLSAIFSMSANGQDYKDTIRKFISETHNMKYQSVLDKWFDSLDYYKCSLRCARNYDSIRIYLRLRERGFDSVDKYFNLTYPILISHPYWVDMLYDGKGGKSSCKCQP